MTRPRIGFVAAAAAAAIVLAYLAPKVTTAVNNQVVYGTFATSGSPPRVEYCGRRYFPNERTMTAGQIKVELALNGMEGLSRIGTAPSGAAVVAHVMSPGVRAQYHTSVCTMEVWVQTGPNSYLQYVLSGGP